jgi:probable FeS assembly SUF system protein SufT
VFQARFCIEQINSHFAGDRNCASCHFIIARVWATFPFMENTTSTAIALTRDCDVTQIPSGQPVRLGRGTAVEITQSLGGSYTLRTNEGLFRLSQADADALGLQPAAPAPVPAGRASESGGLDPASVWEALKTCYDPEIPVNIVDLGLVYDLQIEPLPNGQSRVDVKMTLTAPGCGMGATIAGDAQLKLLDLPGVAEANVEIVWDPPWHHSRISPAGRTMLGLE